MRIAMIGSGYVGLVSGACFSEFGHSVDCVDHDPEKVKLLRSGEVPIYEPGLSDLISTNSTEGRLFFSSDLVGAVRAADVVFIAVGTPGRRGDGAVDMQYVDDAALEIAAALDGFKVIVTKSTVPVGTARRLEGLIRKARPDADFAMVSNPEFLREGSAIEDFMRPDKIVVGVEDERAEELMRQAYRPLSLRDAPLIMTDFETAELVKYANNAFLAMRISFINELSDLCEATGANIGEASNALGKDRRIGPYFLHPGPSYGGSCFPKDTKALVAIGEQYGSPMQSIDTTIRINDERKMRMVEKICSAMGGEVSGKRITVLGISFKPNTDDIREAPALTIIPELQERGALITAHDPAARENAEQELQDVEWASDPLDAIEGADCLVILTEWNAYRGLDLKAVAGLMQNHVIVDLRNVFDIRQLAGLPFAYHSLGRKTVNP
ncbi:MAG: UDP-glucose/GDP-mannose dehydrogenase family protein [Alphaproteobacteria bacterium]|nr:UDP-glucose/GDP-mannose dehydrogenase family protein [Alphaproteobacteria bacterium]